MEFHISEESQKNLNKMLYGDVKEKESKKQYIIEHLKKYHFKTCDGLIAYLKQGGKIKPDILYLSTCIKYILYNKETNNVEIHNYDYCNDKIIIMNLDMFINEYMLSFLPDSNGYIQTWHRLFI